MDMHPQLQSHTRAWLDAWTTRKAQWRIERASGKAGGAPKPQQNDRLEVRTGAATQARQ